jgi:sugar O-acyltransferase (sialic acid O-acetyltransferase NeuD family)
MMVAVAEPEPIFLYGAGGHGRAVGEVIRREGRFRVECLLDDTMTGSAGGIPIVGGREALAQVAERGITRGFVSIGNNADRELVSTLAEAAGLELVTIVDPAAVVASDARLGGGTVLMPMSMAGASARIGRGAIVNTSATVDHDCVVEDYAHLSAGVHLSGGCQIGARSFVGIGSSIGGAVRIGSRAIIGAGAAVVGDIPDGVVAAGVPARRISSSP